MYVQYFGQLVEARAYTVSTYTVGLWRQKYEAAQVSKPQLSWNRNNGRPEKDNSAHKIYCTCHKTNKTKDVST